MSNTAYNILLRGGFFNLAARFQRGLGIGSISGKRLKPTAARKQRMLLRRTSGRKKFGQTENGVFSDGNRRADAEIRFRPGAVVFRAHQLIIPVADRSRSPCRLDGCQQKIVERLPFPGQTASVGFRQFRAGT